MAYTNLTKLANAMNQQSEQEKKPSKATYLPALAGLYAGASLAHSGQRGVLDQELINKKYPENLARYRNLVSEYKADLAEYKQKYKDLADQLPTAGPYTETRKLQDAVERAKRDVGTVEGYLADARDDLAKLVNQGEGFARDLRDAKALRNKKMLGGLGLLGLGVGTTALLRKRKKRKQEQAKLANVMAQQSEQEKKPSKATYIPAVAGLTLGGLQAHSGQKRVSAQKDVLRKATDAHSAALLRAGLGRQNAELYNKNLSALHKDLKEANKALEQFRIVNPDGSLSEYYDQDMVNKSDFSKKIFNVRENKSKSIAKDILTLKAEQFENNARIRKADQAVELGERAIKGHKKLLAKAKDLRARDFGAGLGLFGLGVGTTALLRRRKKRKQEQR